MTSARLTALKDAPARSGRLPLRDLLEAVFYHRRAIAIVMAATVALGIVAAIVLPPVYKAEARLLPLSASVYDMQNANGGPLPSQVLDPAAVANVEMQLLSSLELHRVVVRAQIGGNATPAAINAALDRFERHLHVTKVADANVIEITYTARDPKVAADALRLLLSRYFRSRADALTSGRVGYLVAQRDKVKAQLDAANAAITTYQQRNRIVDVAAQIAGAVTIDDALRQHRLDADAAIADGRQSIASLQSGARGVPAQVELYTDNTEAARAIGEMQTSIVALQSRRADLASRYMAGAPIVTQVDRQIAGLQAVIARQRANLAMTRRIGRNQFFDTAQDRLAQARAAAAGAEARRGALDGQLAQSTARLTDLVAISATIGQMRLQRDVLADTFKTLANQVEQARIQLDQSGGTGSANVRVIEAPTEPTNRSNPPALLIAGAVFAALMIGGVALLVLTSLRDTFLGPQDVERAIDLPVLAAPDDTADGPALRRDLARLVAAIDATETRSGEAGSGRTILLLTPDSRRGLQQAALLLGDELDRRAPGRVVLVRFADGAPVPASADAIAIDHYRGVATGVVGTAACPRRGRGPGLMAELGRRYDYVVATPPPVGDAFDGIEMAHYSDAAILVIEAETTRQQPASDLRSEILAAGGRMPGAILLNRRRHTPDWLVHLLFERAARRQTRSTIPG